MSLAKETPPDKTPSGYEEDVYSWAQEQAKLLRLKRFSEVDLTNVIEEIESVGSEQLHALESSYQVLLIHLLKWQFQPNRRSRSWGLTISRERVNVERREKRNPKLRADAAEIVSGIYGGAVRLAAEETGLPEKSFPAECPYAIDFLRDHYAMPE